MACRHPPGSCSQSKSWPAGGAAEICSKLAMEPRWQQVSEEVVQRCPNPADTWAASIASSSMSKTNQNLKVTTDSMGPQAVQQCTTHAVHLHEAGHVAPGPPIEKAVAPDEEACRASHRLSEPAGGPRWLTRGGFWSNLCAVRETSALWQPLEPPRMGSEEGTSAVRQFSVRPSC